MHELSGSRASPSSENTPKFICTVEGVILKPFDQTLIDAIKSLSEKFATTTAMVLEITSMDILVVVQPGSILQEQSYETLIEQHGAILIVNRKSIPYLCVFKESIIGKHILSLLKMPKMPESDRSALELFYKGHYEESGFLLNDFFSYLGVCKSLCDARKVYSNLMSIVQASGFGKSKLAYESGIGFLSILLSGENSSGFPDETMALTSFLSLLRELSSALGDDIEVSIYIILAQNFLMRIIYYTYKKTGGNAKRGVVFEESGEKKVLHGFREYALSLDWKPFNHKKLAAEKEDIVLIPDKDGEIDIAALTYCFKDLDSKCKQDLPSVVVFIDEASCLLSTYTHFALNCKQGMDKVTLDFYRLFRKCIKYTEIMRNTVYVCLISTTSLVSNLNPSPEDDPSWRPRSNEFKLLPPFNLVQNFDVFYRAADAVKIVDWKAFVNSTQRMLTSFICGRPLFGTMASATIAESVAKICDIGERFDYIPPKDLPSTIQQLAKEGISVEKAVCQSVPLVLQKCAKKYLPQLSVNLNIADIDKINAAFAKDDQRSLVSWIMLSLSIVSFHVPAFVDTEDVIRARMAILLAVDTNKKRHAIMYTSEGQPNAMASYLLNKNLKMILEESTTDTFLSLMDPSASLIMDYGQVGELVARIGLLISILRTPFSKKGFWKEEAGTLYAPRSVFDFVEQMAGKATVNKLKQARPDLNGAICAFNHFQASDELGSPAALAEMMLKRCSARITPRDWHGADLLIPMVLEDGTLSLIVVQVKRKTKIGSVKEVFDKARLENVFATPIYEKEDSEEKKKKRKLFLSEASSADIKQINRSYLIICLNVGEKATELTPESLSLKKNRWDVYDGGIGGVLPGLKCTGLSFGGLTNNERDFLASFCRLGHNLEHVRSFNPQTFAHLGCPGPVNPAADPNSRHSLYPYTIKEVDDYQKSQTRKFKEGLHEFLAQESAKLNPKFTSKERLKRLVLSLRDEANDLEENVNELYRLPSLKSFYEKINWNLFQ